MISPFITADAARVAILRVKMCVIHWRTANAGAIRGEIALVAAISLSAAWLLTTLIFHRLLLQFFALPADAGYYGAHQDVTTIYLLPLLTCVWPLTASALCAIEGLWLDKFIWRARLAYLGVGFSLLLWCRWSLQTNLNNGHRLYDFGAPTDTIQAAAYASICFPLAVALCCLLLAVLRRAPKF